MRAALRRVGANTSLQVVTIRVNHVVEVVVLRRYIGRHSNFHIFEELYRGSVVANSPGCDFQFRCIYVTWSVGEVCFQDLP